MLYPSSVWAFNEFFRTFNELLKNYQAYFWVILFAIGLLVDRSFGLLRHSLKRNNEEPQERTKVAFVLWPSCAVMSFIAAAKEHSVQKIRRSDVSVTLPCSNESVVCHNWRWTWHWDLIIQKNLCFMFEWDFAALILLYSFCPTPLLRSLLLPNVSKRLTCFEVNKTKIFFFKRYSFLLISLPRIVSFYTLDNKEVL